MISISNPKLFRDNVVNAFHNQLIKHYSNHTNHTILYDLPNIARNIEISIYNYAIIYAKSNNIVRKWDNPFFLHIYSNRFKSFLFNFQFILPFIFKPFSLSSLSLFQHSKWLPSSYSLSLKLSPYTPNPNTDDYTCRKCRSHLCSYYEMQTRSADEPSTLFISCLNCGNQWKS